MKYAVVLAGLALLAGSVSLAAAEKKVPRYEGKPLDYWVKRLQKAENEEERVKIGRILIAFGPAAAPAIPALLEMLDDYSEEFRQQAARILGEIGPAAKAAAPALIHTFKKSKAYDTRKAMLQALAEIEPPPDQVVPVLVLALSDETDVVREAAAACLRKIGPPAKAAIPALRKMLTKDEAIDRAIAARALWSIERDSKLIAILAGFLNQDEKSLSSFNDICVIAEAARGLGEVGPDAKEALPRLKKFLTGDIRMVDAVVEAIHKIDPEERRKIKMDYDGTVTIEGVGKIARPSATPSGANYPATAVTAPRPE